MKKLLIAAAVLLSGSCTSGVQYAQAVCALVDVSGTYADQKAEVVNVIRKGLLPRLSPGDSLYVIRIDDESYKKANVEAAVKLDVRPSRANAQKLAFSGSLDEFARRPVHAAHTDIRGAMMLGAEYLRESGAGKRTMVVFSDMQEDLPRGAQGRQARPGEGRAGRRAGAGDEREAAGQRQRQPGGLPAAALDLGEAGHFARRKGVQGGAGAGEAR